MPRGNGTGPDGYGPMTGRAAGYCAGYEAPGYMNPEPGGYARGVGFGRGRGRRNLYYGTGLPGRMRAQTGLPGAYAPYAPPAPPVYIPPVPQLTREQEANALKEQMKMMQESIKATQERIEELEKDLEEQ